jgi:putative zinc finger/helix-turn-helix YgiT family protein
MKKENMTCPKCGSTMERTAGEKEICFRGTNVCIPCEQFACPGCGLEAASLDQTAEIQKRIADAYRQQAGLLTGREIVAGRKKLKLNQAELADRMHVGIASIKRWEGAIIQSRSMDKMLRDTLSGGEICGDPYTGNRTFSLSRVKLVFRAYETALGRKILKKNDKMLFAAKYLWYADMLALRENGEGMTGATYAALPYGPQMNNYRELIGSIRTADETQAEPLSDSEQRIIERIARTFTKDQMVYEAAHREEIWVEKATGSLIPYTDAVRLAGL